MKHRICVLTLLAVLLLCLAACEAPTAGWVTGEDGRYYQDGNGNRLSGWQEIAGKHYYFQEDRDGLMATGWLTLPEGRYYFDQEGQPLPGWVTLDGKTYCFSESGQMQTGWVSLDGKPCYLGADGTAQSGWLEEGSRSYYLDAKGIPLTGWQQLGAHHYYFQENGQMCTGWADLEGQRYYFADNGPMQTGKTEIGGSTYIFSDSGAMQTGWTQVGEYRYYLQEGGAAVTGPAVLDGKMCFFGPQGIYIPLVNPWNPLDEDYETELRYIDHKQQIAAQCYDALMQMLADCTAAGHETMVVSGYRTTADQEFLYGRKVNYYLGLGYSRNAALKEAAKSVAVPGTSEHQLGLAVDIVDADVPYLEDYQADTPAQKWLLEHCYEYGFILRYPADTTGITGIIYEPWHYRYVGVEVARELQQLGITLEEYLNAVNPN